MTRPIVLSLDRDAAMTLGAMMAIAQVVLTSRAAPRFFDEHLDQEALALVHHSVGVLATKMDNSPPSVDLMYDRVASMNDLIRSVLVQALEAA